MITVEKNLKVSKDTYLKLYRDNGVVRMEVYTLNGWGARMEGQYFEGRGFNGDMYFSMSDIIQLYTYARLPKYWSLANQFSRKALEIDKKVQKIVAFPQEKEDTGTIQLALKFVRYQPKDERMAGIIFLLPYHVVLFRAYLREIIRQELKESGMLVMEKHVKSNNIDHTFQFMYDGESLLIRKSDKFYNGSVSVDESNKVYELFPEQVNIIREMTEINVKHYFTPDKETNISPEGFIVG
ncbi:MAG: hypothetical protein JHC31_14800, partial [Sulfurihydrogenibium sp.]|nr:hypothetical protein [Sulfurihydrogenibium sp.]